LSGALRNATLAVGSVLLAFVLTLAADHVVGAFAPTPTLPGSMELLFPPNADQSYESLDFSYTAHINSLGLREREIGKERTEAYRIIAIGDSYTYGWGVESEQTWLRLIEESLRGAGLNVETINMGKPGAGPPDYADLAEEVVPLFRPDLVLVGMLQGNDLAAAGPEVIEEAAETFLDKVRGLYPHSIRLIEDMRLSRDYASRTQEMRPPQKSSAEDNRRWTANTAKEFLDGMTPEHRARFDAFDDTVKEAFLAGRLNPYMVDLAMQNARFYCGTLNLDDPWTQTCLERMGHHLARIKRVADSYEAEVLVLSIPDGPYVNAAAVRNIRRVGYEVPDNIVDSDAPDTAIREACGHAGVPFLTVTPAFRQRRDNPGLFFELDGHLTAEGHRLYAESLAPLLLERIRKHAPMR